MSHATISLVVIPVIFTFVDDLLDAFRHLAGRGVAQTAVLGVEPDMNVRWRFHMNPEVTGAQIRA